LRLRNILILLAILLALSGYFYFSNRPEPPPPEEPQLYVWLIEMEELEHIVIELPREGKKQAFVKEADRSWHFDDAGRTDVDMQRWGGGIPLLLSGPGVDRVISENATEEQLSQFGLIQPQMKLGLALEGGDSLDIKVGDRTPGGEAFYVQVPDSRAVALVDYTWYEVLEKLVNEPPYPPVE
jgi:hypothetical protein